MIRFKRQLWCSICNCEHSFYVKLVPLPPEDTVGEKLIEIQVFSKICRKKLHIKLTYKELKDILSKPKSGPV